MGENREKFFLRLVLGAYPLQRMLKFLDVDLGFPQSIRTFLHDSREGEVQDCNGADKYLQIDEPVVDERPVSRDGTAECDDRPDENGECHPARTRTQCRPCKRYEEVVRELGVRPPENEKSNAHNRRHDRPQLQILEPCPLAQWPEEPLKEKGSKNENAQHVAQPPGRPRGSSHGPREGTAEPQAADTDSCGDE